MKTEEKKAEESAEAVAADAISEEFTETPQEHGSLPASTVAVAGQTTDRGARVERPRELQGSTWRIPFDGRNLYVTVNHDGSMCWKFLLPDRSAKASDCSLRKCCAAVLTSRKLPAV